MKKQRLNENEVRKLMKFANLGTLTSTFVEKLNETDLWEQEDEEELDPTADVGAVGPDLPGEDTGDLGDMDPAAGAEPEGEEDL